MNDIVLSPITLKDFETLIRECVKTELQNHAPAPPPKTDYITRHTAAQILGISLPTLNDWSKRGIITSYKIATRVRYKKNEIEACIEKVNTLKYRKAN
jgi:excisionase family DNA binding protein